MLVVSGCSDLEPGDIVTTGTPPTTAATANFEIPGPGTPVYEYTPSQGRKLNYVHRGTSSYSFVYTQMTSPTGMIEGSHQDRPYRDQYDFYQPSVINQHTFPVPSTGALHRIVARYVTQNANRFYEPNGLRETATTRAFRICASGDFSCRTGGRVAGATLTELEENIPPPPCDLETEGYCDDGGTSGGGTTVPGFQRPRLHTASMGPFFMATNLGSSVSQGELEDLAEDLTDAQVDGIADIVWEAYGEDVHDWLNVPGDTQASARAASDSPFLRHTAALADPANRPSGLRGLLVDRIVERRNRYMESGTLAAKGGTPLSRASGATPSLSVRAWPNPATTDVRIALGDRRPATVTGFDLTGRVVARTGRSTGAAPVLWDLTDATGMRVPSGVYLIRAVDEAGMHHTQTVTVL